jgi:hypothetical protein
LVFLIILIVATAVLVAWLLVGPARVGLGDFRFPRLRESSVQGASPSGSPVAPVPGSTTETGRPTKDGAHEPEAGQNRRVQSTARLHRRRARREKRRDERVLYDESDVEQAVRDRLYGQHGRRD